MRYVCAYMLAKLGGNDNPSKKDIENILGSVGIDADGEATSRVIDALKGKDIDELVAAGREKLASVPAGGAVMASGGGGAGAAPAAGGGAAEEKKEEKKKEESESEDEDMGFGLFD